MLMFRKMGAVKMKKTNRLVKQLLTAALAALLCVVPVQSVSAAKTRGLDLSSLLGGMDLSGLADLLGGGGTDSSALSGAGGVMELLNLLQTHAIKDCTIAAIPDKTYTGDEIKPTLNITYEGPRLRKGTDYTVTYSNNIKVGTAKCKITGKGNYTGTKTVSFKIIKASSSNSSGKTSSGKTSSGKTSSGKTSSGKTSSGSTSSNKTSDKKDTTSTTSKKFTVKVSTASVTYSGTAKKPSVTVTAGGKKVASSNYTVTYKDNKKVGKATVTVKGKGDYKNYTGEATFKITLKKTTLSGASSSEEGSLKCSWKKDSQADGYQIEYCTNKSFKNTSKKVKVTDGATTTYTITKLTSGKNYYVRIRSYKKVGNINWYSEWCAAKSVKVK